MTPLPLATEVLTPELCHALYTLRTKWSTHLETKCAQIVLLWLSTLRVNFLPE